MADFPATKKTFSQIVDGTDYIEGTQLNQAYNEAEAIETFIGAMGRSQTYSSSIKGVLVNYIRGCEVEYKSATEIYVRDGEIYIPSLAGNGAYRVNTADTTVNWSNIDTGSESDNVYYVYAVADAAATTFTIVISLSATTPTGCTYYRRIGSFTNTTDVIESTVCSDYPSKPAFGTRLSRAVNTSYLAYTDGIVTFSGDVDNGDDFQILSDSSNPPTTMIQRLYTGSGTTAYVGSMTVPVKKGDYWKLSVVAGTCTVPTLFFMPLKP
jgi:hypothetical protein